MILSGAAFAGDIPNAPLPQKDVRPDGILLVLDKGCHSRDEGNHVFKIVCSDGFFSFRKSFDAPALRPSKKSWAIFAVSHAAAWGALAVANHQKEHWGQEAPALAGVTASDFAAFKLFSPAFSVGPAIYAIQHYLRAR